MKTIVEPKNGLLADFQNLNAISGLNSRSDGKKGDLTFFGRLRSRLNRFDLFRVGDGERTTSLRNEKYKIATITIG